MALPKVTIDISYTDFSVSNKLETVSANPVIHTAFTSLFRFNAVAEKRLSSITF